jgi:hypothetical protein
MFDITHSTRPFEAPPDLEKRSPHEPGGPAPTDPRVVVAMTHPMACFGEQLVEQLPFTGWNSRPDGPGIWCHHSISEVGCGNHGVEEQLRPLGERRHVDIGTGDEAPTQGPEL